MPPLWPVEAAHRVDPQLVAMWQSQHDDVAINDDAIIGDVAVATRRPREQLEGAVVGQ